MRAVVRALGTRSPAFAVCLPALLVAAWFLIGDLSVPPNKRGIPDPAPRDLVDGVRWPGYVAALIFAVALPFVMRGTAKTGQADPGLVDMYWRRFVILILTMEILVAYGSRICTARVNGANIGAGLALLAGTPLLAVLTKLASNCALQMSKAHRGGRDSATQYQPPDPHHHVGAEDGPLG